MGFSVLLQPIWAQTSPEGAATEGDENRSVFAPFVSKLRVGIKDPQIRLTWQDIPSIQTSYRVYRHTEEISDQNFSQAQFITTIEAGTEVYIDDPPENGTYFYAVLAESPQGEPYKLFIPFRNKSVIPVSITGVPGDEPPVEAIVEATEEPDEQINEEPPIQLPSLAATLEDNLPAIRISFTHPEADELLIYRATSEISGMEELSEAILLDTVESDSETYTDYGVPGVPYFYSVISRTSLQQGNVEFIPNETTLVTPLTIPLGSRISGFGLAQARPIRELGLPLLNPRSSFLTGIEYADPALNLLMGREPTPLSEDTESSIQQMFATYQPDPESSIEPMILPGDLQVQFDQAKGEARAFASILETHFKHRDWKETESLLSNLLTLPLEAERKKKALFYRAQSRFFQGKYGLSILDLLLVRDDLYVESTMFIDASLNALRKD
jgi:hypothetical protein